MFFSKHLKRSYLVVLIGCFFLTACGNSAVTSTSPTLTPQPTLFSPTQTGTPLSPAANEPLALGYYTGSLDSYTSLLAYAEFLDIVSVDVFSLDFDGNVVGMDEYQVVDHVDLQGIDFYACINNWNSNPLVDYFDPELAKIAILSQKEKMIEQLVALAIEGGYVGINIDFENLTWSEDIREPRREFTNFIHELSEELHQNGKKLIISVPAKSSNDRNNTWAYPFNLAALGREADFLQLMTYDQHGPWGGPGPVSGTDWVEECLAYTTTIVEPEKLLIGLPAYGYDWNLDRCDEDGICESTSFAWKDLPAILDKAQAQVVREPGSGSPSIIYIEDGEKHVAWFEDQASLQAKVRLIPKYQLAGLSVWALGMEDLNFWQFVTE